ncbi:E1A ORF1 [Murine adenovirus 1]|uniref:Early E1A 11 kDa protein n=3 Tax=Mastadenovirus encephalomyelitidis TaxID=3241422 RepID=E111_ADEM1|nr:IX [Murine mastadenovirus A]P12533.1 RecName: Full=Early E1A 11 kDa protein [Murine adenovirus 1]AAA42430.1 E1A ORF1 [Murine adenovirus 1]
MNSRMRRWAATSRLLHEDPPATPPSQDQQAEVLRRDIHILNAKISELENQMERLCRSLESTFNRIELLHSMLAQGEEEEEEEDGAEDIEENGEESD